MRAPLHGSGCSAPKPGGSSHGPSYGPSQRLWPAAPREPDRTRRLAGGEGRRGAGRESGGGHRIHGRENVTRDRRHGPGYDHFEVVVDDHTRLAYVAHVPDESARSASQALLDAAVWFAGHGVRIERVLTDNAWAYTKATY